MILKFDGYEDIKFTWPKISDMVLVEEIPNLKRESNDNTINFDKKEDVEDWKKKIFI